MHVRRPASHSSPFAWALLAAAWIVFGLVWPRLAATTPGSEPATEPIVVGQRHLLDSAVLEETRAVDVFLPASYHQSPDARAYPLIVVLDGEFMTRTVTGVAGHLASVGRMPESIVVGIPNNTGRRLALYPDLLDKDGKPKSGRPGKADAYVRFFGEEVLPMLERRYRVADFRALIGLSPTAAFTLHALWRAPELFQAHIAIVIGGYLGADYGPGRSVTDAIVESLKGRPGQRAFLYLAEAASNFEDDPTIGQHFDALRSRLAGRAADGLVLKTEVVPGAAYSIVQPSVMSAFEMIYPAERWDPKYLELMEGEGDPAEKLDALFAAMSAEYGFPIVPLGDRFYNINCMRSLGSRLQRAGRLDESIAVFQRWIDHYPRDPRPYFYQTSAYRAASRLDEALEVARAGVARARAAGDPRLPEYEKRLESFEAAVASERGESSEE